MRIQKFASLSLKLSIATVLAMGISACGGDKGTRLDGTNGNDNNGNNGNSGNEIAQIGYGSGSDFIPGEIHLSTGGNALSAGGSSTLTVSVVVDGKLSTDSLGVTFNSPCFASNEATIESLLASGSDVVSNIAFTNNGQVSVRYTANGCVGDDVITASTSFGGAEVNATSTLTVESDTVQTIAFEEVTPNFISLKGSGGTETALVRFQVLGSTGAPVKDIGVTFTLDTTAGGLALVNDSDISGVDGFVTTTIQSGTVSSTVRITATTDSGISTQSSGLVVSTGLPDQNSMSIAASDLAPIAWRYQNVPSTLTVNLADAFNNPVPDDTAINFTTNGGSIGDSCLTSNGRCSVEWNSQNPKPTSDYAFAFENSPPFTLLCPPGVVECRSGRLKVLATAIGNESFVDANGNGSYEFGVDRFNINNGSNAARSINCLRAEPKSGSASAISGCDDLGDPYIDRNFDGKYNDGSTDNNNNETEEEIANFTESSSYTQANGIYDGVLCNDTDEAAGNCTKNTVYIRSDLTMVMSCDAPYFRPQDGLLPGQPSSAVALGSEESVSVTMLLADCNGNGIPRGTTLEVNTDATQNLTAEVFPTGEIGGSANPGVISLYIIADESKEDAPKPASGTIFVEIEIPGPFGGSTTYGIAVGVTGE